jgi:hypothetical protein
MQQIIITADIESRLDFNLEITNANETHHVFRFDTDYIWITCVGNAQDRRVPYPIVGCFHAEWEYEQVLIFPAQFSNRFICDWEKGSDILSLE